MSIFPAVRPAVSPAVRGAFEQGSGGGAASIIAGLFSAGQQGFWLPFTDFASLTQDSAGTLPYTALEQPVGRVLDRSGRGNHASQVTSTARGKVSAAVVSPPTRPYYLQLDGTDDFYTCGGGGSTTGFYYADVIQLAASTTTGLFQDAVSNKGYILLVVGGTLKLRMYAGNGASYTTFESTTGLVVGQKHFVEFYDDGVNLGIAIDGGAPTTVPRPAVQGGLPTIQLFKVVGVPTFNGQVTEPIYRAGLPPSAYERGVIRAYQMQKAGL